MTWKRSSKCDNVQCVEIQDLAGVAILVRNSKKQHVTIATQPESWRDFIAGVKDGEFDGVAKVR